MTTLLGRASMIIALISLIALPAFPLGYEKGISLSGKHTGVANSATSAVEGAEGLVFNPAALGNMEGDNDFVFNLTAGAINFEAPLAGEQKKADEFITPVAILYSQKVDDTIAWGAGFAVQGGLQSDFGGVQLNPAFSAFEPEFKTKLQLMEFTIGTSYNISEELSVGLGYRISYAIAEYSYGAAFATPGPTLTQAEVQLNNLTGMDFAGARLGAQYRTDDWSLGLIVRTPVKFELKGEAEGQIENSAAPGTATQLAKDEDITVKSSLPTLISLGFHFDGIQDMRIRAQVDWYNYSVNEELEIDGVLDAGGGTDILNNITQESKDSVAVRLGYEYLAFSMPIRAGFIMTQPVTNKGYATPGSEAPGNGYGFALGSSYEMSEGHGLHFAVDYSWNEGEVTADDAINSQVGDYKTAATAIHLGYQTSF